MRLFLAIELSDDIRDGLADVQRMFREKGVTGKYTPRENMHLTVAFIGEYPDEEDVMDALWEVRFSPFELTVQGLGQFSDLWWAGIQQNRQLEATVQSIRHALSDHGIPFDRKKFRGHITLLRRPVYTRGNTLGGISVPERTMTVERITLMRSDRGKQGMIYTPVGYLEAEN